MSINFTTGLQGHINSKIRDLNEKYEAYKATAAGKPLSFEKWLKSRSK